ncbi:MAG: M60 family peptidase N-terminal accessory domain-containing protein [Opitutaceae bacterium]
MKKITLFIVFSLSLVSGAAHAAQSDLLAAYAALDDHINGVTTLTASEINTQGDIITSNEDIVGDNATVISASLDLVETYETVVAPLFNSGEFSRTDTSTPTKALRLAMFKVYQAILDDVYNASNLASHGVLFDGYKFESADYFPGAVNAPSNPSAVYSVQINASQLEAWGYEVSFQYESARRPTGAYLAPGSVATVTVPAALVGKGYEIRVGAHVADLTNRPNNHKRLNRVTNTYPINSTTTEIASPLGGGIYIEVPYGEDEGLVTVDFQNTVRAPFYSNTVARQTTLSEWQNTERSHPGKWADFETDKFMLTVPTDWIYNYSDPVTLMNNWDLAMDACSDLQGLPRIRPKTVLYCIIDLTLDANVFSPGYPQSNDNYNPTSSAGGNKSHDYLNGPKFANHVLFHEFGHAAYISKFNGELESVVNLFYVPVHNRMFNVPLEEAFGRSLNTNSGSPMNRKHAAINWAVNTRFQNGQAMTGTEMKYQHRGYAKYVEIAALFGWDALGDFWKSVAEDAENGITYSRNSDPPDSRIIRMSRAANANLLPLIHMWGVHPNNAASIQSTLDSEGIRPSAAIYDRLKFYQDSIPMTPAEFTAHDNAVGNLINVNERAQYDSWRTTWTASLGQDSVDAIQDIIDAYFPAGRPVASLPHFEDFEDGIGDWAQATDDDFEWRRHSGGTISPAGGPDAAASGDYYMYAEGHDAPGSNKTASFQCIFDFSALRQTSLSFDYHMYGSFIDYLAVDVYDGISWTNNVWIQNGPQHTSSSDPWSSATVDLSSFTGNDQVTIRFRTANTQYNSADPAIDNLSIDFSPEPLPYYEGFESGMGAWEQSTGDDYDWTHHTGGTDTAAAGPSGAASGDYYLYAEGHDAPSLNNIASVECDFDFSVVQESILTFDYHMYGQYIDYLAVDIYDGTSWTNDVWLADNEQHTSSGDPWSSASVDLTSFTGNNVVTVRFRTANTLFNAADPAIDNIRIGPGPLALPYAEDFENGPGAWEQSVDDDYDWTHHTGGTDTAAAGPDGASSGVYYMYAEGHHGLGSNKTAAMQCVFDFSLVHETILTFDYHMYGNYIDYLAVDVYDGTSWTEDVWIRNGEQHAGSDVPWSSATVDLTSFTGNDAVTIRFRTGNLVWNAADPAIDNIRINYGPFPLPYTESFEDGMGAWLQSADDDYDWTHHTGGTETAAAGPDGASDGSYYLYAEGHHGLGSNKTASVYCAFDFTLATAPELSFDYHMRGFYIDYLAVDVHDGTQWTQDVWLKDNQQHFSSEAPWSTATVDLSAYAGNGNVTLRFRTANTQYSAADPAIDNIRIMSRIQAWRLSHFGTSDDTGDAADSANPDSDSLNNFLEFAFGTDPNVSDATAMTLNGSSFTPGLPIVNADFAPLSVKARFIRLVDHASNGIIYTAQFSHDLSTWEDLDGSSAVRIGSTTETNGYEAVEMNYPLFLINGRKAQFFRMDINSEESGPIEP